MINDVMVEIIDMMIDMCGNKQQELGMCSVRELIYDFDENEWSTLSLEERYEAIKQYMSCKAHPTKKLSC